MGTWWSSGSERREVRMDFWGQILVVLIASVAAVATAFLGFRDLGMRRRLETSKQFLNLFATAHGRPVDGRDFVGVGEQIATLHLIADFAKDEPLLRHAAVEGLRHFTTWGKRPKALPGDLEPCTHRGITGEEMIASAASKALKRLSPRDNTVGSALQNA